jgi:hypothetical protein
MPRRTLNAAGLRERARLMYAVVEAAVAWWWARKAGDPELIAERDAALFQAVSRFLAGPGGSQRRQEPRDVRVWERDGPSHDV